MNEWQEERIRAEVVCRTPGCVLEDQHLEIEYVGVLVCAGCNAEITDITPTEGGESCQ